MITDAELKLYKSENVSDGDPNGGGMSFNQIISGAVRNIFPSVTQAERTAGNIKHRKVFMKVASAANEKMFSARFFLDRITPGEDLIAFFQGTMTDVQGDLTGAERMYGGGTLDSNVAAGALEIDVVVEDGTLDLFQDGDLMRVTTMVDVFTAGQEEFVVIVGDPVVVGDVLTVTFAPALQNNYLVANTRVQSVLAVGDVGVVVDDGGVTSAAGLFDFGDIAPNNIGGIHQEWTLTFTSAVAYDVTGDTLGAVGAGTVGAGASPMNPNFGEEYFQIPSGAFSGVWVAGDTVVFSTEPAAVPLWLKRIVPAGAAAVPANSATLAVEGDAA